MQPHFKLLLRGVQVIPELVIIHQSEVILKDKSLQKWPTLI